MEQTAQRAMHIYYFCVFSRTSGETYQAVKHGVVNPLSTFLANPKSASLMMAFSSFDERSKFSGLRSTKKAHELEMPRLAKSSQASVL